MELDIFKKLWSSPRAAAGKSGCKTPDRVAGDHVDTARERAALALQVLYLHPYPDLFFLFSRADCKIIRNSSLKNVPLLALGLASIRPAN
jgi:hypothetical protein